MSKLGDEAYIAHLSIDCVIFGYQDKALNVFIAKSKFGRCIWSLPGGYIRLGEGIDQAASRVLAGRTGLAHIYLEQFQVFGDENRIVGSPYRETLRSELHQFNANRFDAAVIDWMTSRFICIGYYALVDIRKFHPQAVELDDYLQWRNVNDLPEMIHDHRAILTAALDALRQNLDRKLIGFKLLPETFTMREVQQLYEAVYNRPFVITNFQKKLLDLNVLERLQKKYTGASNKAPYLYRFKNNG